MSQEKRKRRRNRHDTVEQLFLRTKQDRDKELRNYFLGKDGIKRLLIPLALLMLFWLLQELGLF